MGDMADYYIELGLNAGEGFAPRHRERRGYYGPRYSADLPKPTRCKHCGTTLVFWQMTRTGYRLHNREDLQLHNCSSTKDMNTQGFEDAI